MYICQFSGSKNKIKQKHHNVDMKILYKRQECNLTNKTLLGESPELF